MRPGPAAALVALPLSIAAACYAPSPASGLPCSPTGACPAGQVCDLVSMTCDGTAAPPDALAGGDAAAAPDAATGVDAAAGPDAAPVGEPRVYAHTPTALYAVDPVTLTITAIGPMTGCSVVLDLALSPSGQLVGVGSTDGGASGLLSIDPVTGACGLLTAGAFGNALSFVPAGVLDPGKAMLLGLGSIADVYGFVAIDPDTGAATLLAPQPMGYSSSGDVAAVGARAFWTAVGPCSDCLVELDAATGALVHDWGAIGADQVYGLAAWDDQAIGFTGVGEVVRITFGVDSVTSEVVATPGDQFYGAAAARVVP